MTLKTISSALGVTLLALAAQPLAAQQTEMRDSPTSEQLAEQLKVANNEAQKTLVKLRPSEGPDPAKASSGDSLVKDSDFLAFNGKMTLVPKMAILHTPPNMVDRVKFVSGNQLMPFGDFYAVNRAWITTYEVTRAQAEGNQPFPEDVVKRFDKSTTLVVAVFKGGPISVLPPKPQPREMVTAGDKAPAGANTTAKPNPSAPQKP
ncbi:hypothetical protein [Luteolibacter luteus]|uniref:Uncharacterized protein n=1 Tax=Luteolibacter luteus TaxID=2728835 RepID=A0A858RK37_9BACT|nr:hypothetical protein [Luteolibacter luteus]QJE97656.1 hypothetical protein HHL09_18350 [Luteolibacter luteus]